MIEKDKFINSRKKCFILGTGPSLKQINLSLLENHVTIGVNLILCSGFTPNYLCVSDREMIADNYDKIINPRMLNGHFLIVRPKEHDLELALQKNENVTLIDGFKEPVKIRKPYIDPTLMSFAMTKNGVINDLAASLAVFLGFKDIYLLGVDGQHGKNTHFYDSRGIEVNSIVRSAPEPVTYDLLLPILKSMGVDIYNCSPSNKHVELQYRDFEELLK